jgi:hypothetical protein
MLAVIVAIAAFGLAAQGLNPVKEGVDHGIEPIGQSIGVLDTHCKDGWVYLPPEQEGTIVSSPRCFKDGYVAFLNPEDRETCQYVMDTGTKTRPGQGEMGCELAGYK